MTEHRAQLIREYVHLAFRLAQKGIEIDRLPQGIVEDVEWVNEVRVVSEECGAE